MNYLHHTPVLLHESVTSLAIAPTDTIVDGTFGGGGHSKAIAALVPQGTLICVDLDEAAEARFGEQFADVKNVSFVHANFKDAAVILAEAKIYLGSPKNHRRRQSPARPRHQRLSTVVRHSRLFIQQ
jgi:16S rRNA (cytosine1402-N4)-methyltransferase